MGYAAHDQLQHPENTAKPRLHAVSVDVDALRMSTLELPALILKLS